MQPQTDMIGVFTAVAMCIAPVSPPIARLAFLITNAVSLKVERPQSDVTFLGNLDASDEPRGCMSGPPTITKWESTLVQIASSVDSGSSFP